MRAALERYASDDPQQQAWRERFLQRLDDGAVRRDARPDHLTASGVVVDAARTRTLLVLHRKVGLWLQPGGHLEDGDTTLGGAALREAVEETGVPTLRLLDRVVHLDVHAAPCDAEHHLDVRFLVEAPDDAVPVGSEESLDVRWFGLDEVPGHLQEMVRVSLAAGRTTG